MEKPTYQFLFVLNIITLEEKNKRLSKTTTILSELTCYSKSPYLVQLAPLLSKTVTFKAPGKPSFRKIPSGRSCTSFPPLTHLQFESHPHLFIVHCAHSSQLTPRMLHLLNRLCVALSRTRFFKNFFCISFPSLSPANSYRAFQEVNSINTY